MKPNFYHAHIYFDSMSRPSAERLRADILAALGGAVRVHELIDEPIGPHPLPMFEVDVPAQNLAAVRTWLSDHHGSHSILIHPLTGDDLADHRDFPEWVGPPLKLDLVFLEKLNQRF